MKQSKSKSYPKVCAALMIKNEEKRLRVSLDSVFGVVHEVYIYDTGSTDGSLNVLKEWSEETKIPVFIKQDMNVSSEDFDFSFHRNILLEWIDNEFTGDFVLLLDSNDEVKGKLELREWLKSEHINKTDTCSYSINQQWYDGNGIASYWNVRIIKPRSNMRYKLRRHEYIHKTDQEIYEHGKLPLGIVWFQDRQYDNEKSMGRLETDKKLLLQDYEEDKSNARIIYYLAQTCNALGDYEEAMKYYKERTTMEGNNKEEILQSYTQLGFLSTKLEKPFEEISGWYLSAYKFWNRAEPLTFLANYCVSIGEYKLAYMFITEACSVGFPVNALTVVDLPIYSYKRYLLKAIVASRLDMAADAIDSITTAYDNNPNDEQVKGVYDAIYRKYKDYVNEQKLLVEIDNQVNDTVSDVKKSKKELWKEKWKESFRQKTKNVNEEILEKLAESTYNNFKSRNK